MLHYAQPPIRQPIHSIDGYAAKVNETIITRSDVRSAMSPILPQLYRRYQGDELEQQLEQAYLNAREQLIDQALIVAAFEAREDKFDYYVESEIDRIIRDRFNGERARFEETLAAEQITYDEYLEKHAVTSVPRMLIREEVNQRARISPETIRITYESNRYDILFQKKFVTASFYYTAKHPRRTNPKTETAELSYKN